MKTITKIKIAIVIFVLVVIIVFIFITKTIKKNVVDNVSQVETINSLEECTLNMDTDFVKIVRTIAEKDADWSNLPLSKGFMEKYKNKDGILKNDNFTEITTISKDSNKEKQIVVLIVFHNAKKEQYHIHYTLNENNELDDVEIVDKVLLYDEEGNEIIYKSTMKDAYIWCISSLAAPGRLEWNPFERIYVTDNYLEKWGAGFVDYDTSCGVTPLDKICDENNQIVYLEVIQDKLDEFGTIIGDEWIKYFKVYYYTNEDYWLDDVEVEEVSKEEINKLLVEK